jgi:hypothetical protein
LLHAPGTAQSCAVRCSNQDGPAVSAASLGQLPSSVKWRRSISREFLMARFSFRKRIAIMTGARAHGAVDKPLSPCRTGRGACYTRSVEGLMATLPSAKRAPPIQVLTVRFNDPVAPASLAPRRRCAPL